MGETEKHTFWGRTQSLLERIRKNYYPCPWVFEEPDREAPYGYFEGRRIIGRNAPINGGVYLGMGPREAIVVDDEKYPDELNEVYQDLKNRMEKAKEEKGNTRSIFEHVYDVVVEALGGQKNPQKTQRIVNRMVKKFIKKFGPDQKVPLNDFIKMKAGVCRHRALLAAYLIERLIREGMLRGRISVDRSTIPGRGGHAWARYEAEGGIVIIIDPSLGYVGPIENAPSCWTYKRPSSF